MGPAAAISPASTPSVMGLTVGAHTFTPSAAVDNVHAQHNMFAVVQGPDSAAASADITAFSPAQYDSGRNSYSVLGSLLFAPATPAGGAGSAAL